MSTDKKADKLKFFLADKSTGNFASPKFGDAGFDLRSTVDIEILSNSSVKVNTSLFVSIPLGWVGIIKDRSSVGSKEIYTHGGVIDASYRGEILVIMSNRGSNVYKINRGDKIAQMVVVPCLTESLEVSSKEELGDTERGELGFGSSGVR